MTTDKQEPKCDFSVTFKDDGKVLVQGNVIPGRWYYDSGDRFYFQDEMALCTDSMSAFDLKSTLYEMYKYPR